MSTRKTFLVAAIGALALLPCAALAQTTVVDQTPIPFTGGAQSEGFLQSYSVPGGTVDCIIVKPAGAPGTGTGPIPLGAGCAFVPGGGGGYARFVNLTDGKSDLGVPLTAAAGTPTGAVGVSRTAGTSLVLVGEATSSNAKTDKVMFEMNVANTYVSGANIPVIVNANYTGSGTPTAATTTITVAAYTEIAGVEAALTVSAAQQFTGTAANYTFTITGASSGLAVGSHIVIEITMLVTNASGANTGQINSVSVTM
jgi:hypothetical protein